MYDAIKPVYSQSDTREDIEKLFQYIDSLWKRLSSYTHSGGYQIDRRFTGDELKPSYTETELVQGFNLPTMALMLLMRAFFMSMGDQGRADQVEALSIDYFTEFNERLSKGR